MHKSLETVKREDMKEVDLQTLTVVSHKYVRGIRI